MGRGHGLQPPRERLEESVQRARPPRRLRGHGLHRRQDVAHPVVDLGDDGGALGLGQAVRRGTADGAGADRRQLAQGLVQAGRGGHRSGGGDNQRAQPGPFRRPDLARCEEADPFGAGGGGQGGPGQLGVGRGGQRRAGCGLHLAVLPHEKGPAGARDGQGQLEQAPDTARFGIDPVDSQALGVCQIDHSAQLSRSSACGRMTLKRRPRARRVFDPA